MVTPTLVNSEGIWMLASVTRILEKCGLRTGFSIYFVRLRAPLFYFKILKIGVYLLPFFSKIF